MVIFHGYVKSPDGKWWFTNKNGWNPRNIPKLTNFWESHWHRLAVSKDFERLPCIRKWMVDYHYNTSSLQHLWDFTSQELLVLWLFFGSATWILHFSWIATLGHLFWSRMPHWPTTNQPILLKKTSTYWPNQKCPIQSFCCSVGQFLSIQFLELLLSTGPKQQQTAHPRINCSCTRRKTTHHLSISRTRFPKC